jgi:hypothetical protein
MTHFTQSNGVEAHAITYCLMADDNFSCALTLLKEREAGHLKLKSESTIENCVGLGFEQAFKAWLLSQNVTPNELKTVGHDLILLMGAARAKNVPFDTNNSIDLQSKKGSELGFIDSLTILNSRYFRVDENKRFLSRYPQSHIHPQYNLRFLAYVGKKLCSSIAFICNEHFKP